MSTPAQSESVPYPYARQVLSTHECVIRRLWSDLDPPANQNFFSQYNAHPISLGSRRMSNVTAFRIIVSVNDAAFVFLSLPNSGIFNLSTFKLSLASLTVVDYNNQNWRIYLAAVD